MARVLHAVTLRVMQAGIFCLSLTAFLPSALAQTNAEADDLPTGDLHNLKPFPAFLKWLLWSLAVVLIGIAVLLIAIRHRATTDMYKETSQDEHWKDDSEEYAGDPIAREEVAELCEVMEKPAQATAAAAPAVVVQPQTRLFTPASGPAWHEGMLKAFLTTCMKVNCLGLMWREAAAWQAHSPDLPDPREAELVRRLMQRWQEFHVDPETGVFAEHSSREGKSRVCVISVVKDKRTLVEASINAGFVIESVGRYLRNTDLVYRRELGDYHAPTRDELKAMTPGERESMIRIVDIPDPWQVMIT